MEEAQIEQGWASDERAKTISTVKEKKRGFFQRWFDKKIISAAEHVKELNRIRDQGLVERDMSRKERARVMEDRQLSVDPIRFSLYRANGGYVVETNMRNRND
jgi:hypothetical protein